VSSKLALRLEDFGILGQHVFTFHAGLAGEGAYQNGNVNVGERLRLIRRAFDAVQIWECAILQFHDDSSHCVGGKGQVEHNQVDRLILSENVTLRNQAEQGIGNLSRSSSHNNANRHLAHFVKLFKSVRQSKSDSKMG